jgi:hypothetical protein
MIINARAVVLLVLVRTYNCFTDEERTLSEGLRISAWYGYGISTFGFAAAACAIQVVLAKKRNISQEDRKIGRWVQAGLIALLVRDLATIPSAYLSCPATIISLIVLGCSINVGAFVLMVRGIDLLPESWADHPHRHNTSR